MENNLLARQMLTPKLIREKHLNISNNTLRLGLSLGLTTQNLNETNTSEVREERRNRLKIGQQSNIKYKSIMKQICIQVYV